MSFVITESEVRHFGKVTGRGFSYIVSHFYPIVARSLDGKGSIGRASFPENRCTRNAGIEQQGIPLAKNRVLAEIHRCFRDVTHQDGIPRFAALFVCFHPIHARAADQENRKGRAVRPEVGEAVFHWVEQKTFSGAQRGVVAEADGHRMGREAHDP